MNKYFYGNSSMSKNERNIENLIISYVRLWEIINSKSPLYNERNINEKIKQYTRRLKKVSLDPRKETEIDNYLKSHIHKVSSEELYKGVKTIANKI